MREWFERLAQLSANAVGSPLAFLLACASVFVWAVSGPAFGWSDTWQLIINTSTTVLTFLIVFLIQNSQNRDTREIKALLREIAEDLPDVDDARARDRAKHDEPT